MAQSVAAGESQAAWFSWLVSDRPAPVLFLAPLPASRPGYHYEQAVNCLLPRSLEPGRYQVFVQWVRGSRKGPRAPAGSIAVR